MLGYSYSTASLSLYLRHLGLRAWVRETAWFSGSALDWESGDLSSGPSSATALLGGLG